jgi:glycosyltransferase involved in cell wall biosynthesis
MRTGKRLRIALVTDVFNDAKVGGVRSARRIADRLAERNDVLVVSTGAPGTNGVILPRFHVPFARRLVERNGFVFAWPDRALLEEAFRKVDIVHVQFPFLLGLRAVRIARRLGVPVVAGFHVQPENVLRNLGIHSSRWTRCLYRFFVNRFYNRTDAVICPSTFAENELKRHGLKVPAYVVPNGLSPEFKPSPWPGASGDGKPLVVLTVGRLAREKRHDVIVRGIALSHYRDRIQLIVSGRGPLEANTRRIGRRLPRPARVLYASDRELLRLYNSSDLYVHASEVELDGMTVLEALGCGLPPLIADAPASAARQYAPDNRFLFAGGNPAALAGKLDYWIEHPDELAGARKQCMDLSAQFRIERSVEEQEQVYAACLAARRFKS